MDVAVIGAAGAIGRQVVISLVEQKVVPAASRLQLVGRLGGVSERILPGLAHDVLDAYGETCPEIDVCYQPEEVVADILVVAGGSTMPVVPNVLPSRTELAEANIAFFLEYAQALKRYGHGQEIVLVVSNPVELGVECFARYHDPCRVLGMGAYLDTLRFRLEIAKDLAVRRQQVSGLVLGDHGVNLVPCWSTVHIAGMPGSDTTSLVENLRKPCDEPPHLILSRTLEALHTRGVDAAYRLANEYPPDVRTYLLPLVTHSSGAKTPVASAEIIARLICSIINGEHVFGAVQAQLHGEVYGLQGVTGVPVILSNLGIERFEEVPLWDNELQRLRHAATDSQRLWQKVIG